MEMIKALALLFCGLVALVMAVTGYAGQYTLFGWDWLALSPAERLLVAPVGLIFTAIGILLVYQRQ
jgi:hypothetical protein